MWLTKRKLLFCLSQASLTTIMLLLYHFTQPLPCWLPGERSRSTETAGRCLLQQGLEESGYLASDKVFSHFACPLGGPRYPRNLCTISPVFLNHSARSFVARAQGAVVPRSVRKENGMVCTNTRTLRIATHSLSLCVSISKVQC